MTKPDRRIQRTREMLQKSLIHLIHERGYDAITVQDVANRANVARTTFYVHYTSKDDLFLSCHEAIIHEFQSGPLYAHPLSQEELLAPETPPGLIAAYEHLKEAWVQLYSVFQGQDGSVLLKRIRDLSAKEIEANLRHLFSEDQSAVPLDMLANYLAGAQIALIQWWLEKHNEHTPKSLAQTFHRLQRADIRDAFGLVSDT